MIRNEADLLRVTQEVSKGLQEIQDFLKQEGHPTIKVKFPYGFIRTAKHFREQFPFIAKDHLVRNIGYSLILSDVYRWVLNRIEIKGTAREMIIKQGICLFGSLCESITKDALEGRISSKKGYKERTEFLLKNKVISDELKSDLDWLWDTRNNDHLFLVAHREHQKYYMKDYNRAIRSYQKIKEALNVFLAPPA